MWYLSRCTLNVDGSEAIQTLRYAMSGLALHLNASLDEANQLLKEEKKKMKMD